MFGISKVSFEIKKNNVRDTTSTNFVFLTYSVLINSICEFGMLSIVRYFEQNIRYFEQNMAFYYSVELERRDR